LTKRWLLVGIIGALLVPGAAVSGGAPPGQSPPTEAAPGGPSPGDRAKGHDLYLRYCSGCHGEDGRGEAKTFRPSVGNLAVKQLMDRLPDEYLFTVIKNGGSAVGKNAAMPAWRSQLSDQEIRDIIAFVRTLARY
jgi:mono/diheme cytochrome c family protein